MIKTKRDALEKFVREQMLGPGACSNNFSVAEEGNSSTFTEEVLNTTPGSIYSTGILFPQRIISNDAEEVETCTTMEVTSVDSTTRDKDLFHDEDTDGESREEILAGSQAEEEDMFSLSQRFPTTIGISICLNKEGQTINSDDLSIEVSGRYYRKLTKDQATSIRINIASHDQEYFKSFFLKYFSQLSPFFIFENNSIRIEHDLTQVVNEVKESILSINLDLCKQIAQTPGGTLDHEYSAIGENYRYLKSYKERLWHLLNDVKGGVRTAEGKDMEIINRINSIEKGETALSYLDDALNICNPRSFGYWKSESFCKIIDLSGIDLNITGKKAIFSPNKNESLRDVVSYDIDNTTKAALSVWVQVTRDSQDPDGNNRYIKIQLENTSTPFEENNERYFSIVTEKVNERSFFGVGIKVESKFIQPYHSHSESTMLKSDVEALNYLYRSIKDYGVGHLCSVDWDITADTKVVKSEFIPSFETPDVESVPRDKYSYDGTGPRPLLTDSTVLQFKWLSIFSDASDDDIVNGLLRFVDSYKDWIDNLYRELSTQHGRSQELGNVNANSCLADYSRMRSNIEKILSANSRNMMSFRLMNAAMFIQLWHGKNQTTSKITKEFYRTAQDDIFIKGVPATWRPFQLAFILLNLDGIIQREDDPQWNSRNELVDLVWFPTGGGKTEAYLGIIALTIINRRRSEKRSGGTTAIMRYTLRLLATQQFQRALKVILALEQIRKWGIYELGDEMISIGLFVGDNSLPNMAAGDDGLLNECGKWNTYLPNGERQESKIPLDKCPYCGDKLEYINTGTATSPKIVFRCHNVRCTFSKELPVKLCDEDIYQTPPTLLFGTVDKFAAIGHKVSSDPTKTKQDSRRIFGRGSMDVLPPSLIIQDELHLLLGPLGSAVSLFECAIDQLCSYKKRLMDGTELTIRPKIISSTATTRNTDLQIRALYDRDVSIFPKSGIDYDDSFFAFYKRELIGGEPHFVSKRKYIGILPTGRTQMTTQMRLVATMFVHRAVFEKEYASRLHDKDVEEAIDYYHSVVDYFNSLKEVGKTDAQFYTEFTKYTRRLFKRVLRYNNMLECLYCYDSSFRKSELTGRLSGPEVVRELTNVSERWKADKRLPYQLSSGAPWIKGSTPPDLILATNMISVGLDVDRFNTIVMNSMPRNVAEYIQASSRVARSKEGLVVALHNPFRMRDLSHFEKFKEFHEKLYYYVEPISITPFSRKSVERYLPLYLATMIRHSYDDFASVDKACNLTSVIKDQIKLDLCLYFKNRLVRTELLDDTLKELLNQDLENYIESFIDKSLEGWLALVNKQDEDGLRLRYSGSEYANRRNRTWRDLFLEIDAYQDADNQNMWAVPKSLRTVESEAVINVKEY